MYKILNYCLQIMADCINFITHNANGLANANKRRELFHYFHIKKYDICFVQETHSTKKCETAWSAEWGNKIWFSHGEQNSKGVGIPIHKRLGLVVHNVVKDTEGRYIMIYVTWMEKKFLLANVYAPKKDCLSYFEKLTEDLLNFSPDYIILGGNFNLALDPNIDRSNNANNNDNLAEFLQKFVSAKNLIDVWRHFHPDNNGFTWRRLRPRPNFIRLDYLLVNENFEQFINRIDVIPGYRSDHSTVKMTIQVNSNKRGPGY